mgnify:CR=1 FL=1
MTKVIKKVLSVLMAVAVIAAVFAGCSSNSASMITQAAKERQRTPQNLLLLPWMAQTELLRIWQTVLLTNLSQRVIRKITSSLRMRRATQHLFQQSSIRLMTAHIPLF